jgi:7,8-dihydroneopterin aldolase/epimerase/oxygenase
VELPGHPPAACVTDRLEDTVCYATLIESARALCREREFHLVEHLAYSIGQRLVPHVPTGAALQIRVTKCHPPVEALAGGVTFTLDLTAHSTI